MKTKSESSNSTKINVTIADALVPSSQGPQNKLLKLDSRK